MLKIKKIFNKKTLSYFTIFLVGILMIAPIALLIYSKTNNKKNFVLANYQSYMAPEVQDELKKTYEVSFDYFESVENAQNMLKKNTADIINTTSYELKNWIENDLIQKIDWKQLGYESTNAALDMFSDPVKEILNQPIGDGILLDYGIPYFLQDLVFAYRGEEIKALISNDLEWNEVLDIIVNEPRFKTNKYPNLIALNDPRTIYSIPRAIENNGNINPIPNSSISQLQSTYQLLTNKLKKLGSNMISFNSDSSIVLNKLALNEVNGAFCFNGDALYASMGGDEGTEISPNDFHIIKPKNNLVALDLFCFNKKLDGKQLLKAYSLIKDLCLSPKLVEKNFNYLYYTPTLMEVYDKVITNYQEYIEISNENLSNRIEEPLDALTKSNFQFAWIDFKSSL